MAQYKRNPWPKKIVWLQDDVTHTRFYWLKIPDTAAKQGQKIVAEVEGQTVRLTGDVPDQTQLRLSDQLLDLDREITVAVNGREVFKNKVSRTVEALRESLKERADPSSAATSILTLKIAAP
jgi:hypothetical protein